MKAKPRVVAMAIRPTTAIFVDDDIQYLKALSIYLTELGISHLMFNKITHAIKYLQKMSDQHYWLRSWAQAAEAEDDEMGTIKSPQIKLPINRLIQQINEPNRFLEISCACFDQKMPVKTGLEAIEALSDTNFKKAMLTGRLPPQDAIEKFNEKAFDVYVSKHEDNAIENIAKLVERARHVYFKEGLERIISDNDRLRKVLPNKEFNTFYDKFVADNGYCESYLIDDFGSLALFDKNMKAVILAVIHDDEIMAYYEMASMADEKPDSDVLNLIKERKAFPFFYGKDIAKIEPKQWGSYLVPATKIEGSNIFYSILDDVKKYGINTEGLTSYADFLAKQDPFEYV